MPHRGRRPQSCGQSHAHTPIAARNNGGTPAGLNDGIAFHSTMPRHLLTTSPHDYAAIPIVSGCQSLALPPLTEENNPVFSAAAQ